MVDRRTVRGGSGGAATGKPSANDSGSVSASVQDALAVKLRDLSLMLQDQDDVDATLDALLHAAVDTVPGAGFASISSVEGRREVRTLAATSDVARGVDQAQYDTGQGPCLDSLYERATVRVPDMAGEDRWPDFATRARQLGVGGMLAIQLYVRGNDLGALNLHSEQAGTFDDESEHVGLLFASHAAIALVGAQTEQTLRQGLDTRDLIGQAKGILMERHKLSADQAFRLLVHVSQNTNRKLRDIAEDLTTTGALPADR
jgi:GAF domain-containing protein